MPCTWTDRFKNTTPIESATHGSFSTISARADARTAGQLGAGAAERPDVDEQQRERERDQDRFGQHAEHERDGHAQITKDRRAADVAQVGIERDHQRERGQDVFALGHPRHRFDAHRMNREHRGHECAAAGGAGRPVQEQKQQRGRDRVERERHQMMTAGPHAKQLGVDHVRDPGDRMEVGRAGRERPLQVLQRDAGDDVRIVEDVARVVPRDEVEAVHRPEHGEDQRRQRQRDQPGDRAR